MQSWMSSMVNRRPNLTRLTHKPLRFPSFPPQPLSGTDGHTGWVSSWGHGWVMLFPSHQHPEKRRTYCPSKPTSIPRSFLARKISICPTLLESVALPS